MNLLLLSTFLLLACHGVRAAASRAKLATLQPWLNGLTAVVVFLLLAFGALVIRRLLKGRGRRDDGRSLYNEEDERYDDFKQTNL